MDGDGGEDEFPPDLSGKIETVGLANLTSLMASVSVNNPEALVLSNLSHLLLYLPPLLLLMIMMMMHLIP